MMGNTPGRALLFVLAMLAVGCAPSAAPAAAPSKPAAAAPPNAAAAPAKPAAQAVEGSYKLGMSTAITGPFGGTYGPAYEGFKVYIDRLNDRGGIDGRRVEVVYTDDRGEPPRATANAKRLVEDERVLAMLSNSSSATYAPLMAAARSGRTPLIFQGVSVCPQEVYPPQPDPWLFCSSFNVLVQDSLAMVQMLQDISGGREVRLGLVAADIPVSRQGVDLIEKAAGELGMQVVGKVAIPPATADYGPFASRLVDAGANYIAHWAPLDTGIGMITALGRTSWPGTYLAVASPQAENETARLKQANLYFVPSYSFTADGLPVFREIEEAAKQYNATYPYEQITLGWVSGQVVEAGLRACGWPCDGEKLRSSLETVRVDTLGIYGGPVDWTPTNHLRSAVYYKSYRWDAASDRIAQLKDWFKVDVR